MSSHSPAKPLAYGYYNATDNGAPRLVSRDKAKAQAAMADAQQRHPHIAFALVTFRAVEFRETVWKQGQGRAGNNYPIKQTVTRWIECK